MWVRRRVIDVEFERSAKAQRAVFNRHAVGEHIAGHLLGIGDEHAHAVRLHSAGVADLAA